MQIRLAFRSDTALSVESAFLVHVSQSSVRVSMDMARIALVSQHAIHSLARDTCPLVERALFKSNFRPLIGRDYPLNLSISLSGGKETNKDSLSNGE